MKFVPPLIVLLFAATMSGVWTLDTKRRRDQSSREHAAMMEALRTGDLELLSDRLKAHNRGTLEQVRALLTENA